MLTGQDMTAFVARNANESIGIIDTSADKPLTEWVLGLAQEYSGIESGIYSLMPSVFSLTSLLYRY